MGPHPLEIALERGGCPPMLAGLGLFAQHGQGTAEPIMNVALVGQQVLRFAQVPRRMKRGTKVVGCLLRLIMLQGRTAQCQMTPHELPQGEPLAAFPGLELSAADDRQGLGVPACLIQERRQFHAQIVALGDQVPVFPQLPQPLLRRYSQAFPKLVALEEQPGTRRARPGRPAGRRHGPFRASSLR